MATTSALSGSSVTLDSDYLKLSKEVKSQNELDKDAFLSLLCTQMQYQDPLNPMDNSQMLAQLAQFTALEQMMNVAQVNQKQLANSMVGKYVEYQVTDSVTKKTSYTYGKVDFVDLSGSAPKLGIGDVTVGLEDVMAVVDAQNIQANTSAFDLIGKTVQATYTETDAAGKKNTFIIEGPVDHVQLKDGEAYVVIGSSGDPKNIVTTAFSNVRNIVEKTSITGRTITAEIADKSSENGKKTITGVAEYIKIDEQNNYTVYVNGQFVDYNDIISVGSLDQ